MIKTDAKPATPELIANLIELGAIYVKDGEFYANEPGTYRKKRNSTLDRKSNCYSSSK